MNLNSLDSESRYSDSSFLVGCFALTANGGNTDGGARTVDGRASVPRPIPSNSALKDSPAIVNKAITSKATSLVGI